MIAIVERVWKLIQPSPEFRPPKSPRYALDIFQWGYFAALLTISSLISTTLARGDNDRDEHELQIRLMSMPVPVLLYFVATLTLISLLLGAREVRLPFRVGSMGAGGVVRPAVYYIVEDVVAVDGNGGIEYRKAFNDRYENSEAFRKMIWTVSVAWMAGFYTVAGAFTILVFRLPKAAVYAVGWAGPFPMAGLMAIMTILYVKATLKKERRAEVGVEGLNEADEDQDQGERRPLLGGAVQAADRVGG